MTVGEKGARLPGEGAEALLPLLARALKEKVFDAVLLPLRTPGHDSFAYVLVKQPGLLDRASPLPAVQTTVGGKALSDLTRQGGGEMRITAVLRPCEARGAIELAKLGQVDLSKIALITMDCAGTVPLQSYFRGGNRPSRVDFSTSGTRPICQMCEHALTPLGALHLGWCKEDETPLLIPVDDVGAELLGALGLRADSEISSWLASSKELARRRTEIRERALSDLGQRTAGLDHLMSVLDTCINCHNCMRVCPVCYCRVCAFDRRRQDHTPDEVLELAESRGNLRLPLDTLMFHLGRMNHMSLNCVSCGACEDACPAGIPIAQIFAMVGDRTQAAFGYRAGLNVKEKTPLITFLEEELEAEHAQGH